MKKEHEIYLLIQAMEPSEKAYVKKYSFKKHAKNRSHFLLLFDVLDKQKKYNLDKLLANKKLPSEFNKNIYANLYTLKKEVLANLIEYSRSKNQLSILFDMFLEYDIYKSKKLVNAAKKKIIAIEKYIQKNDLHYFKPYLYNRMNEGLLNNIAIKKEYKITQYNKFEESIEEIYHRGKVNILSSKFEILIQKNAGLVFKIPEHINELKIIKNSAEELLAYFKDDFTIYSALHNNLLMMNMMLDDLDGIEQASKSYVDYFKAHSNKLNDEAKATSFLNFKNLAYHNIVLKNNVIYKEIISLLTTEKDYCKNADLVKILNIYIVNLKALFYVSNPKETPTKEDIQSFLQNLESIEKSNTLYYELLTATSIILTNENRFKESLDLTSEIFLSEFTDRINDSYVFLKCIRAICWLKLEKIDLFDSELESIYKFLLKYQNFSFAKQIINFIKKSANEKTKNNKVKVLKSLLDDFDKIQQNGTLLEKMEATELKLVLKLALKK